MTDADSQTILVVDDDPTISEVVTRYLEREGYVVETALDGAAALEKAQLGNPDLVVLDLMLPQVDGLEVWITQLGFLRPPWGFAFDTIFDGSWELEE